MIWFVLGFLIGQWLFTRAPYWGLGRGEPVRLGPPIVYEMRSG